MMRSGLLKNHDGSLERPNGMAEGAGYEHFSDDFSDNFLYRDTVHLV